MVNIKYYITDINNYSAIMDNVPIMPRETFDLHEYRSFSDAQLRECFVGTFRKLIEEKHNVTISVSDNDHLLGFIILEFMPFDTEIFDFNVYRIARIYLGGSDDHENSKIISILLCEMKQCAQMKSMHYLTLSINANSSYSSLLFNAVMGDGFKYISTLISFKMTKADFLKVNMHQAKTSDISVRLANIRDRDVIVNLAKKAYKINRFHMDPSLDKKKCDLLHATSVDNAIHGYVDVVIVAEYKGSVIGYYTAKKTYYKELNATMGYGLLTAVDETVRGLGVYSQINNRILEWFYENTDIAEMGTYLNNTPIHKTFTNNGLSIVRGIHQFSKILV